MLSGLKYHVWAASADTANASATSSADAHLKSRLIMLGIPGKRPALSGLAALLSAAIGHFRADTCHPFVQPQAGATLGGSGFSFRYVVITPRLDWVRSVRPTGAER